RSPRGASGSRLKAGPRPVCSPPCSFCVNAERWLACPLRGGEMLQVKEPTLVDRILAKEAVVGVCGLGYVGLPLALTFGEKGFPVIGFDIDQRKIDAIAKGESYIKHIAGERIANATKAEKPFAATMDFRKASEADALIMCVP